MVFNTSRSFLCIFMDKVYEVFITLIFGRRNYITDMEDKRYETPEIEVLEIDAEGVLCASNEILDENEGEW